MQDLDNVYTYHAPRGDQPTRYEAIRAKAKELAQLYKDFCPIGREQAIAHTNLEQSVMWANAAIARAHK